MDAQQEKKEGYNKARKSNAKNDRVPSSNVPSRNTEDKGERPRYSVPQTDPRSKRLEETKHLVEKLITDCLKVADFFEVARLTISEGFY